MASSSEERGERGEAGGVPTLELNTVLARTESSSLQEIKDHENTDARRSLIS